MNRPRFMPVTGYLLGGMLLWAAAFAAAYGVAAVVCARRFADTALLGIPIIPFSVGLATLAALAGTGAIGVIAYRHRTRAADEAGIAAFVRTIALSVALMAVVGIVWNGLPALFFAGCA